MRPHRADRRRPPRSRRASRCRGATCNGRGRVTTRSRAHQSRPKGSGRRDPDHDRVEDTPAVRRACELDRSHSPHPAAGVLHRPDRVARAQPHRTGRLDGQVHRPPGLAVRGGRRAGQGGQPGRNGRCHQPDQEDAPEERTHRLHPPRPARVGDPRPPGERHQAAEDRAEPCGRVHPAPQPHSPGHGRAHVGGTGRSAMIRPTRVGPSSRPPSAMSRWERQATATAWTSPGLV